jgi:hypothetical protein
VFIITNGSHHFVDIITVCLIIVKLLIIQLFTFHYGLIAHNRLNGTPFWNILNLSFSFRVTEKSRTHKVTRLLLSANLPSS